MLSRILASDHGATPDASGCAVDCTHLPHVRAEGGASCFNGKCFLPYYACELGFANCSGDGNTGCETDVSKPANCGACGFSCTEPTRDCRQVSGGFFCLAPCTAPLPDGCGHDCVDLQNDPANCGGCGISCSQPNALTSCQQGHCVLIGCAGLTVADCTADPGCETDLGTPDNCGACGDPECALPNTLLTCGDGSGCAVAVCAPGYANCDTTSPDCETMVSSPGPPPAGCLPHYVGTLPIATQRFDGATSAVAPDGSFFLAGAFTGSVDFDPSMGRDREPQPTPTATRTSPSSTPMAATPGPRPWWGAARRG